MPGSNSEIYTKCDSHSNLLCLSVQFSQCMSQICGKDLAVYFLAYLVHVTFADIKYLNQYLQDDRKHALFQMQYHFLFANARYVYSTPKLIVHLQFLPFTKYIVSFCIHLSYCCFCTRPDYFWHPYRTLYGDGQLLVFWQL